MPRRVSLPDQSLSKGGPVFARRTVLGGALALAACRGKAQSQPAPDRGPAPPLKSVVPFPVGCSVMTGQIADPAYAALFNREISQLTPEWEMKMEYILRPDGTFRFDAPDAIAAFARANAIRLYCTTMIWYAQKPAAFERIDGQGKVFADAYRNYVLAVAGHYRGQAVGWDVVNEPVAEDGNGLRECLWSRNLGQVDYMRRAFDHMEEADPGAVRFINEYNLESRPAKRATYLRLIEQLLKSGAPLGGIGNQCHLNADLAPGEVTRSIRELAAFGLPIHISEIDVSLNRARGMFNDRRELELKQARLYGEVMEAMMDLPPRQRFAFTVWGLRDKDSWLTRKDENPRPPRDETVLFDDAGRAKPAFWAVADAARGRR
jgi:endo-1,4-beta-xylanase